MKFQQKFKHKGKSLDIDLRHAMQKSFINIEYLYRVAPLVT